MLDLVLARRRFLAALRRSRFRDADARRRLQLLTNAREVDLSGSEKLTVPLAISSHEICVPENLWDELTPGEKDALLAHEVAHVERRDPAWFLVEQMIERVLFAQPLLRVLRRASRRAAELACDERAALATQRPIELARCLATVAGWSQRSLVPVSIASMARRDASVVGRVERLLQMEAQPSPPHRQRAFFFGLGAALIAFACAAPGVVADGQASDLRHARALPLEGAALLVEIERNGRAHLASRGGQEPLGTFELNGDTGAFRTALEGAAKKLPRGGPGPLSHMLADGVLRIRTTADTPFYYAQLVMQTCGTRNVMIWNLELETAGRGDAVFPYQLPVDVGVTGDALPGHFEIDLRVRPDAGGGRALEARFGFVAGDPLQEVEESEATDGAESAPVVTIDGVRRDEWRPKEQLDAALDGPAFPSQAAGAVTIRLYDGVTGGEAARLIDQVLDAGATDILFVGVIPR